ncbi:MAG: hypothetical protein NTU79_11820 [Planctomycetota bacterium]|nr:hypothetical protein [Planctomycetota bacterium]
MQNKSNPKQSRSRGIQSFVFAITTVLLIHPADAQVVQLPTTGSFSIQSGVSVPDSGSAYAGGYRSGAIGQRAKPTREKRNQPIKIAMIRRIELT